MLAVRAIAIHLDPLTMEFAIRFPIQRVTLNLAHVTVRHM